MFLRENRILTVFHEHAVSPPTLVCIFLKFVVENILFKNHVFNEFIVNLWQEPPTPAPTWVELSWPKWPRVAERVVSLERFYEKLCLSRHFSTEMSIVSRDAVGANLNCSTLFKFNALLSNCSRLSSSFYTKRLWPVSYFIDMWHVSYFIDQSEILYWTHCQTWSRYLK